MVNFPTRNPDCDSHSPALLDLLILSISSTMVFSPLGNFDHVFVSVSIDFSSYSQWDTPFLRDHFRNVPWEDMFILSSSAATCEFCKWVQVGIGVYISHRKYQVKSHSSSWFSAFNSPEVFSSVSDKAKLFAENFSKNSNLDDSGISLPVFPFKTNLKVHNISVTPKMVKKVIMNLDLSRESGPDFIPVVVLKSCEPELSYILAELFNKYLKES